MTTLKDKINDIIVESNKDVGLDTDSLVEAIVETFKEYVWNVLFDD